VLGVLCAEVVSETLKRGLGRGVRGPRALNDQNLNHKHNSSRVAAHKISIFTTHVVHFKVSRHQERFSWKYRFRSIWSILRFSKMTRGS